jgi:hypothetical protein
MKNKYQYDQDNYYPSMVDMMAGILFIMIILLMGFVIQEKVQKEESPQAAVENKVDILKKALIQKISDALKQYKIISYPWPEENALIIPARDVFTPHGTELTKKAVQIYGPLSKAFSLVLTQTEEGIQCLSNGYLDRVLLEVHGNREKGHESENSLRPWGRTIAFYGAFITAETNPKVNQLFQLKNKNAHQILSIENFTNNLPAINDFVLTKTSSLKGPLANNYIVLRFWMFYPPQE